MIAASVTFVILMIPRGVSTTISLDPEWDYADDVTAVLDSVAYLLQYTNHATNFFLYVLANNSFRYVSLNFTPPPHFAFYIRLSGAHGHLAWPCMFSSPV